MINIPFFYFKRPKNIQNKVNIHIIEFGQRTPLDKNKTQQALRSLAKSDAKLRRMGLR